MVHEFQESQFFENSFQRLYNGGENNALKYLNSSGRSQLEIEVESLFVHFQMRWTKINSNNPRADIHRANFRFIATNCQLLISRNLNVLRPKPNVDLMLFS